MASCELCGGDTQLMRAMVEGTELEVCKNCSSFGTLVSQRSRPIVSAPKKPVVLPQELTETEAVFS